MCVSGLDTFLGCVVSKNELKDSTVDSSPEFSLDTQILQGQEHFHGRSYHQESSPHRERRNEGQSRETPAKESTSCGKW